MKTKFSPFKRASKNQGLGLLSTIIAVGITSVLMISMMDMMALNARAQQSQNFQNSLRDFLDHIRTVVVPETACSAALAGAPVQGMISVRDPDFSDRVVVEPGQLGDGWSVQAVQLTQLQAVAGGANLFRATLNVQLQQSLQILGVPAQIDRDVSVIYVTVTNGKVLHCYGTTNWLAESKTHCDSQGGTWIDGSAPVCSFGTSDGDDDKNKGNNNGGGQS